MSDDLTPEFVKGFQNAVLLWSKEIRKDKVFMKEFNKSSADGRELIDKMLMDEVNHMINSEPHFQPNVK